MSGGYDDAPRNRWDRERFEQVRYQRQESRPRREVLVEERVERPSRPRYVDERRLSPPRFASRVRREVYEDDVRYTSDRALQPYRGDEYERDREIDIERRRERIDVSPRPGLHRRQSSLDTYDRRPAPRRVYREEDYEPLRRREEPAREQVRETVITREREVDIGRSRARSDARSVHSDARSSHHSRASLSSPSRHDSPSPSPVRLIGKKGHTRLPKGQFKRAAVERFGVDFTEEDDFYRLHRALDKTMIDQILSWSRDIRETRSSSHRYDDDGREKEHYETIRTEWINPPSVGRAPSPARSQRTVRVASPEREEIKVTTSQTIEGEGAVPAAAVPLQTAQVIAGNTFAPQPMTLALTQRTERSHQDMIDEIRRLELERDVVRLERGMPGGAQIVYQSGSTYVPYGEYQLATYKPGHHKKKSTGDVYYVTKADEFKPEKRDKKPHARAKAAMLASLT